MQQTQQSQAAPFSKGEMVRPKTVPLKAIVGDLTLTQQNPYCVDEVYHSGTRWRVRIVTSGKSGAFDAQDLTKA